MSECVTPWTTWLALAVVAVGNVGMLVLWGHANRLYRRAIQHNTETLAQMDGWLNREARG